MRIVVIGYHNIGCRCLEVLLRRNQNVVAVFTHRDDPNEHIWFDSVANLARTHRLPCHFPDDINKPYWVKRLNVLKPDLIFSFYFRQIFSPEILKIPRMGAINLHGSYLPWYRGRCPVNWVLINGEKETGVTLHYMTARPDEGDIIARAEVPIDFEDTALILFHKLEKAAVRLFDQALYSIVAGTNRRIPQDISIGSCFGGRRPEDGWIDWTKSSIRIYNLIRAVTRPYPGAFTYLKGKKLFVWKARPYKPVASMALGSPGRIHVRDGMLLVATGQGAIRILECQVEGGREMVTFEKLNTLIADGDQFDQEEHVK